tara:strand:- start:778 stop:1566 length:789 start_codon:yes stop_codon:yes gene_type:complete
MIKYKIKPHIICDKNNKSLKFRKIIKKIFTNTSIKNSNLIIIIGGDGFMLNSLKKNYKYKKPFYGINSGTYGFLMNKFSYSNLNNNIASAKQFEINPLKMLVIKKNNQIKKSIAINEVSILRQSKQAASIMIKSNKKIIINKLMSDGVLVSTPAGSTAYNLSIHGPILDLNSKKLAITPISPFRPRRWKGKIINEKSIILIRNLDISKRPISAVADNIEIRNAKKITIQIEKKIKLVLLYNKSNSLDKKIKIEQLRKETHTN